MKIAQEVELLVSTDDVDWYCFNMTAAGKVTVSTEKNDGFFQPKPTDTFIAIHNASVPPHFSCTTFVGCKIGGGQGAYGDDSNRTPNDPY